VCGELLILGKSVIRHTQVKVVGLNFDTAPLAIMFQLGSPLRRNVDTALAALRENGTYQQIYDEWFGP